MVTDDDITDLAIAVKSLVGKNATGKAGSVGSATVSR